MNGETRPAGAGFDHLQEEVSPSGCVGSRVVRNRGPGSSSRSLTGFDVDPTVDPHHVVITQEIQCSGLPDQLTSAGELVTGHLIQPVVETLSQVADGLSRARPTSSLSASMNSSGALHRASISTST